MIQTPVKAKPQPTHTSKTPKIVDQPQPAKPFALYQNNAATVTSQPVQWLWQNRIPATGITILDGDHGLGKSLLALQVTTHISSGTPMPDGTPTIQGGVVIITPHGSPTQLQHLTSLGADLEHIRFLSYVHDPNPQPRHDSFFPTSDYRPFSLPEDLPRLIEAIEQVNARLIILDPFIYLLSPHQRHTKLRLSHLLTQLNQLLAERNIACLLLRNCRAKGGHAQPSTLEKSDHFPTIAASRLLLAPDPMQPDQILLSHALNRHTSLTHTLTCQIQPLPTNPDLAHITTQGHHSLTAAQLLTQRPDTLHRHLLSKLIPAILAQSPEPTHATDLYALFSHSSISQVQHALKDLLLTGQIQRPARGLYSSNTSPSKLVSSAATTSDSKSKSPAAITPPSKLVATAATTPDSPLISSAAITPDTKLVSSAATTPHSNLITPAATTTPTSNSNLVSSAATTTPTPDSDDTFSFIAIGTEIFRKFIPSAATTPTSKLVSPAATTPKPLRPPKHTRKQNKHHGRPR